MKFNKNDFVYYLPTSNNTGVTLLIIFAFDATKQKYKCYEIDVAPCEHEICAIVYVNESELDFAKDDDKNHFSYLIPIINNDSFDESYYPVFDCDGTRFTQIRKAIRRFDMQSHIRNKMNYRK